MLQPGDIVDGRFEVEALVGRGGLADVYRVRHVALGSRHALKLLTWQREGLARRLLLEGRIQAQLHHPNVVQVTDLVRHAGQFGLLMEYVAHNTLDAYLAERGALPVDEALDLLAPILAGVAAAHASGVLHRDIKPGNVMLVRTSTGVVPKVTDFGIAKVVSEEMPARGTKSGVAMGTPGYLAPEQLLDSATVDARADVFALGAILYEMLTGHMAFCDDSGMVLRAELLEGRFTPISEHVDGVPDDVAAVISAALAPQPAARFADALELAQALFASHPERLRVVMSNQPARKLVLGTPGPVERLSPHLSDGGFPTTGDTANPRPTLLPDPSVLEVLDLDPIAPVPRRRPWGWVAAAVMALVAVVVAVLLWPTPPEPAVEVPVAGATSLEGALPSAAPLAPAPEVPAAAPEPVEVVAVPAPRARPRRVAAPEPEAEPEPAVAEVAEVAEEPVVEEPAVEEPAPEPIAVPEPAPVVVAAEPEPEPEPEPVVAWEELVGLWKGTASGKPFQLQLQSAADGALRGKATTYLGATQRTVTVRGTLDPATGAVALEESPGPFRYRGVWADGRLTGTYARGSGKRQPFELTQP